MSAAHSLVEAQARDARHARASRRDAFCFPRRADGGDVVYLCGNSLGLQPRRAAEDVAEFLRQWQRLGVLGYHDPEADWLNLHERLAPGAALLAGARREEVIVMNSLTINLHLLMASFYRPTRERHVILIEQGAFPSDRYAVVSQLGWHGLDPAQSLLQVSPRRGDVLLGHDDLVDAIERAGTRLALVLLPGIQYLTGQVLDMGRLVDAAHRAGALIGFDLAHAIGNVPLALHDWNVDFAVWCSYKYLNGGPGATAGAFVHERHFERDLPRLAGWWGNELGTRFEFAEALRPYRGAAGWQVSNHPLIGMVPLLSSFELFTEAGPAALRERSVALTGWLEELLDARLGDRVEILTPRGPGERGAQLSLRLSAARGDARAFFGDLLARGLTCDWREPDVIRLAPAPLYNSHEDCWRAVALIEEALGARRA